MTPRTRAFIGAAVLIAVALILFRIFPRVFAFTEMAASEARYFWWLVLLVALAFWLIWGFNRKP